MNIFVISLKIMLRLTWLITYSIMVLPYFIAKHRSLLDSYIKSTKLKWMLDSFLSPSIVFAEVYTLHLRNLFFRGLIFFFAICFFPLTLFFAWLFFTSLIFLTIIHYFKHAIFPYHTKFKFQSLPIPIQQRFFQLQPPMIRHNLSKAYFNPALISSYNDCFINDLYINNNEFLSCFKLCERYDNDEQKLINSRNLAKFIRNLAFWCSCNEICKCPKYLFKKFTVINQINVDSIPTKIHFIELPILNNLNLKKLIIKNSVLNLNEFLIISNLNLDFILLHLNNDGTNFDEKLADMLKAVVGTAKIRLKYNRICENQQIFRRNMLEWISSNNYVESIKCEDEINPYLFSYFKKKF